MTPDPFRAIDVPELERSLRDRLWYRTFVPKLRAAMLLKESDPSAFAELKEQIYALFERALENGTVALGSTGKDWDAERAPIDTIVIHHTSNPPGMSLARLSAIELVRLYAPYYFAPTYAPDADISGTPIYSGHFRNGAQVFWPYHWFVRADGSVERLLHDHETGWHAGNWDINCRSIAICFDDDLSDRVPSAVQLEAAARIIRTTYPFVLQNRILGHREVNPKTTCPSKLFLESETGGWKRELLALL